jgi:hypothetical protein
LTSCFGESDSDNTDDSLVVDSLYSASDNPAWTPLLTDIPETKIDSMEYLNAYLTESEGNDGYRVIKLYYDSSEINKSVILSDTIMPYGWVMSSHKVVQLNGGGGSEIIVTVSWYYSNGGWGVNTGRAEGEVHYYVFDPSNSRILFHAKSSSEYMCICGSESGSDCESFETGYRYRVHFDEEGILIDSVYFHDESGKNGIDNPPGLYKWHDGMFVRTTDQ